MKKLILTLSLLITLLISSAATNAATMKQVSGAYDVFLPIMNANMIAHVSEEGHMDLEVFSLIYLNCTGENGRLEKNVFIISPKCNGAAIDLKIDLSKVKNFNKFKAPVYSSMIGRTVEMEFTRR